MRQELIQIEKIEQFLNNTLSVSELAAFKIEIANSSILLQQVETQDLIQQAVIRKALRGDVVNYTEGAAGATGGWSLLKLFLILGGGLMLLGLIIGSLFWNTTENSSINNSNNYQATPIAFATNANIPQQNFNSLNIPQDKSRKTENNSNEKLKKDDVKPTNNKVKVITKTCGGLNTWVKPKTQYFMVNPKKGATIEGNNGTLIIVPKNAFVNQDGSLVAEQVKLELLEALQMSEMIAYNLVTMNNDKPLSSGGMIYVQATANNIEVNINPKAPLYIEIPTDDYNTNMMSWEGKINENGDINWENPKPLIKYLNKVDFANLDFLPEGFDQAVAAGMPYKNHTEATDELVDSLYYNLGIISIENKNYANYGGGLLSDTDGPKLNVGSGYNSNISLRFFPMMWEMIRPKYIHGGKTVKGRVIDQNRKGIENVSISINQKNKTNKQKIVTDEDGYFEYTHMNNKSFTMTATKRGYSSSTGTKRRITLQQNPDMNPNLIGGTMVANNYSVDSIPTEEILQINSISTPTLSECAIDPQSIKTIIAGQYQNTFLATREFEERLKALHRMPDAQSLFEVYINNLTEDLYLSDQKVADLLSDEDKEIFLKFAAERLTNVENHPLYQEQLSEYYTKKKKEYTIAYNKQQKEYNKLSMAKLKAEEDQLNSMIKKYKELSFPRITTGSSFSSVAGTTRVSNSRSQDRKSRINAIAKLNKRTKSRFRRNIATSKNSYKTVWYQTGWMNIDAYLHSISINSEIVSIDVSVQEENKSKTKIYQCLNSIKAIIPLAIIGKLAEARFPNKSSKEAKIMSNTYCIGLSKEDGKLTMAYQKYNPYDTDQVKLTYEEINPDSLITILENLPGFNNQLINNLKAKRKFIEKTKEINKQRQEILKEINAQKKENAAAYKEIENENSFIQSLQKVIDRCGISNYNIKIEDDNLRTSRAEYMPSFPGCEMLRRDQMNECSGQKTINFIKDNISYPIECLDTEIEGQVYVYYEIGLNGKVQNSKILESVHPLLDAEALRVIRMLPDHNPGVNRGKNVIVMYTFPVVFEIEEDDKAL